MKRFFPFLLCVLMLAVGCGGQAVTPLQAAPHTVMEGVAITLPEEASPFAKAIYEATDRTVNEFLDTVAKKKPEFISFVFSSDLMLSAEERQQLQELFAVYGAEISQGQKSDVADLDRGITVSYASIASTQTSDCDLTIPVRIYYGSRYYTYCSDFIKDGDTYILFRFELLNRTVKN